MHKTHLTWLDIFRLGAVQSALGSIVVLTTSVLNRVMVVELALAASVPGALVALHYAIQISRPKFGYKSDQGGRRTPWIIGGVIVLACGAIGASLSTMVTTSNPVLGIGLAMIAFVFIGLGVGASGTSLLALLATRVEKDRRPAAATIVWTMMIASFAITAGTVGHFLDPFSLSKLVMITSIVCAIAVSIAVVALYNLENSVAPNLMVAEKSKTPFFVALREVWDEPQARIFTIFVFASMLAYSAQDLILEPFAGLVFNFSPGESTKLSGVQHAGILAGMLCVALIGSTSFGRRFISMRTWTIAGCLGSSIALISLAIGGHFGITWPLAVNTALLGFANGIFAVAAIGSMMTLAGKGREKREGVRMGLWGAAQAFAFGLGGFAGTVAVDLVASINQSPAVAYGTVFVLEGTLFVVAAVLAGKAIQGKAPDELIGASSDFQIGLSNS